MLSCFQVLEVGASMIIDLRISLFVTCAFSVTNLPLFPTLSVLHKLILFPSVFSLSIWVPWRFSSLTHGLFRRVLFRFQMFGCLPVFSLLLILSLTPLWSESILCDFNSFKSCWNKFHGQGCVLSWCIVNTSVGTWKVNVFCFCWLERLIRSYWFMVLLGCFLSSRFSI